MRKIILNLAMSLDGFIADEEGGFAWIQGDGDSSHNTKEQFDFAKFMQSIDIIVMGKKAFLDCPQETLESFTSHKIYVASHTPLPTTHPNIEFISGDIVSRITNLKKEAGKDIWLFGGAHLLNPFIKAKVIDEFIIGFIPIILGKGIPLFLEHNPLINLHLQESTIQGGIVICKYVKK